MCFQAMRWFRRGSEAANSPRLLSLSPLRGAHDPALEDPAKNQPGETPAIKPLVCFKRTSLLPRALCHV
jgi:hypothetical protein